MFNNSLCTPAWLLIGLTRSLPGILKLEGGRLSFINIERRKVFDAALDEIKEINFPWHYFGAGLKLRIGTVQYRLSFIEPDDGGNFACDFTGYEENIVDLSGRKAGTAWKSALIN